MYVLSHHINKAVANKSDRESKNYPLQSSPDYPKKAQTVRGKEGGGRGGGNVWVILTFLGVKTGGRGERTFGGKQLEVAKS